MNMEYQVSQEMLDRLVDGELDEQSRREVIQALRYDDQGWQRCAIAFLEAQAFRRALDGLSVEQPTDAPDAAPGPSLRNARAEPWRTPRLTSLLAVAAGLLIAFSLGRRVSDGPTAPEFSPAVAKSKDIGSTKLASYPDLWQGESVVEPGIEDTLRQLGLRVNRQQGLVPVQSSDGNQWLVPYEEVSFQPVSATPQ